MNIINTIKNRFNNSSDLIIKKLDNIYIIYLESICDSDKINFYILQNISLKDNKNNFISGPNTIKITNKDIEYYLVNGFSIVISNNIYAVETRGNLIRGVEKSDTEPSIIGPKDSFNENIQTTLGLIKRRIKTNNLINEDFFIGKNTLTKLSLLYIEDKVDKSLLKKVENKLNSINQDIISIDIIKQLLSKESRSVFPTIMISQRPDNACFNLLEGKIILICDNSPFCLILPSFFTDFINPIVDNYNKSINVNFLKILRIFCLIFTIIAPALYISLINYNQEVVPISLLKSFAISRSNVAYPSWIEAIIMLIICSILKESDLRFPSNYGSAISIVGALIIGEAAVNANLISPIMIIIIAFTFITSLIFTDQEFVNGLRQFRFLVLLLSSFFGLYGLLMGIFILLIHLSGIEVLDKSYTYPLSPLSKKYLKKTIIKTNTINEKS